MRPPLRHLLRPLAITVIALVASTAHAGWGSMGKVNANPPMLNEKFGCSVAVDGKWMAVGASDSTIGAARNTGVVHLFRNDDGVWNYRQSLSQDSPLAFQAFGNAVALRGDTLAVGSWGSSGFAGRVFVYNRGVDDTWTLSATLSAADPQPGKPALFGWSLGLDTPSGEPPVIVVGRPNDGTSSGGALYVFEFDGTDWNQVKKLTLPEPVPGDQLGTNLSVRNGTIVAGVARRRMATLFERVSGTWSYAGALQDAVYTDPDGFGSAVASGGSFVAVGAPSRAGDAGLTRCGAVVVFSREGQGWKQTTTLTLEAPRSGDNFGYALTASPSGPGGAPMLAVGAPGFDAPAADGGVAFAYSLKAGGWKVNDTDLWSKDAISGQFAGKQIAASSDGLMVALASELPRGSVGGVFPVQWLNISTGSQATRSDTGGQGDSGGSGSGGGLGGGGSGGGGSGGGSSGGGLSTGDPGNPNGNFGQGGRPRPLQPLPPLVASFGKVTDTVIVDAGALQSVIGLQTDGVQRTGEPETKVLATYPATWKLAATGDCNGDASGDLIWEDDTRNIRVWLRDGTKFLAQNTLRALAATERVVASVDFDGDGVQDIVTRDTGTKQVHVLRMRNGTPTTEWDIALPTLDWQVVPHRLESGVLLRHARTGEVVHMTRNPLNGVISAKPFPSPSPSARIEGMGDFDGNGTTDMVTRDPQSGELSIWRLDKKGGLVDARDTGLDGSRWHIQAVRDWDGNGCDDLLVSEGGGGRLVVLYMHFQDGVMKVLKSRVIGDTGGARVVDVTPR